MWETILSCQLPGDIIAVVRQYHPVHFRLLHCFHFQVCMSPSMCVLDGHPYIHLQGRLWINPLTRKTLLFRERKHNNWIEQCIDGDYFGGNDVACLFYSKDWTLQLVSIQWDQGSRDEEIEIRHTPSGERSKIKFEGGHSYVFDGKSLYSCPKNGQKVICKYSTKGLLLAKIVTPPELLHKHSCFGSNGWTVFQEWIIIVAHGKVLVYCAKTAKWQELYLDGNQHEYASITCDAQTCFIASGGNLYSVHIM
jgi:hypothetical protein